MVLKQERQNSVALISMCIAHVSIEKWKMKEVEKKPMILTSIRLSHVISVNLRPDFQRSLDFYFIFSVSLLAHDNAYPILISVCMWDNFHTCMFLVNGEPETISTIKLNSLCVWVFDVLSHLFGSHTASPVSVYRHRMDWGSS